jgi:hypothetical protein
VMQNINFDVNVAFFNKTSQPPPHFCQQQLDPNGKQTMWDKVDPVLPCDV